MQADAWFGVCAPRGTPADVVATLNNTIVAAIRKPDINARMVKLGLRPTGTSATELARIQKVDFERWGPVAKASGFKPTQRPFASFRSARSAKDDLLLKTLLTGSHSGSPP
jgi:tripartite-type tricarboxylate transporter receptor subunit TctC